MNWRVAAEFAAFQAVWLACALGAARGSNVPGLLAASTFIALQVLRQPSRPAILAMLASGIVGFVVESLLAGTGVLRYAASWPSPHLAPAWIVALWMAFGITLATTARLLTAHALPKAGILGAVFGPLSYVAGAQLGALDFAAAGWITVSAVAAIWALSFPGLLALRLWLEMGSSPCRVLKSP